MEDESLPGVEQSSIESIVPDMESSMEAETMTDSPPTKIQRRHVEYVFEQEFDADAAKEFLKKEGCWSIRNRSNSQEGLKIFYRCNRVKSHSSVRCNGVLYLLHDAFSKNVRLYRADEEHDCHEMEHQNKSAMTPDVIKKIEEMCDLKKKPLAIMDQLAVLNMPVPKKYQIANHLAKYRKQKYGPSTLHLSDLRAMLDVFAEIPTSLDGPFAIYEIEEENESFRFFITSRALIANANKAKHIQADATYKLLWHGFPVLVVGTTDMDRTFHLIGVAVTENETQKDFEFLFESVRACAETILGEFTKPDLLVCDAAKAIQNAFKTVFGDETTIVMCWAHMLKNAKKKLMSLVKEKADQASILADIYFLQTIPTVPQFETAMALFVKKWSTKHSEYMKYFISEWVTQNPNWFEGIRMYVPSTNNALEATNRRIKDDFTFRNRMALGEFVNGVLVEMIGRYSRRCSSDLVFATEPTISHDTWEAAYHWAKLNKPLAKKHQQSGHTTITVTSATYNESSVIVTSDFQTLGDFKKFLHSWWIVTLESPHTNWLRGQCSCPIHQKEYACKHTVGIAVRVNKVAIPNKSSFVSLQGKRKRGRPALAKKAYVKQ